MNILLDHNLDRRLKRHLGGFDVATTQEQGWADVQNGELIRLAETDGFDAILTADANIKKQQDLAGRQIAILVLRAFDNRLTTHVQMIPEISRLAADLRQGEIVEIFHPDFKQGR